MATTFDNMATLSYNGNTMNSNVVTGELTEVLTAAKTAVLNRYEPEGTVTYVVTMTNTGGTELTGLTLRDNLGGYAFGETTLYPLAYEPETVQYYVNGVRQAAPAAEAGAPLVISGLSIPAGGNMTLLYEARVTRYAPLAVESEIENTAVITGGALANPVTVTATVGAASAPHLCISKSVSPTVVAENGRLTYTFVIQNRGNTAVTAADDVILRDVFDPALRSPAVTLNGTAWTEGTQYTYDAATGTFATAEGQITVPAAEYAQNPVTGVWTATPGVSVLVVSGTV